MSLLTVFLLLSDYLIWKKPIFNFIFWGLYDSFVHGVTAVIVLIPFFKKLKFKIIILIYLLAVLLDIDHFIMLGYISLKDAAALQMRPPAHSITFALAAALTGYLFTKRNICVFWIIFASLASHIIRDAASGVTPVFFPFKFQFIQMEYYLLFENLILIFSYLIGKYNRQSIVAE